MIGGLFLPPENPILDQPHVRTPSGTPIWLDEPNTRNQATTGTTIAQEVLASEESLVLTYDDTRYLVE